jgi:CO/xanthine dehydrogenase Mo-binding subunit
MDVHIMERPYEYGPFGAKGVGELPIDGPAPALVNAVRYAGFEVTAIPVLPEVLAGLAGSEAAVAADVDVDVDVAKA